MIKIKIDGKAKAVYSPPPLLGWPHSTGEKMQEGRRSRWMGKQPSCRYKPDNLSAFPWLTDWLLFYSRLGKVLLLSISSVATLLWCGWFMLAWNTQTLLSLCHLDLHMNKIFQAFHWFSPSNAVYNSAMSQVLAIAGKPFNWECVEVSPLDVYCKEGWRIGLTPDCAFNRKWFAS